MSETFRPTPAEQPWSTSDGYKAAGENTGSNFRQEDDSASGEAGKALLIGLLGGLLSAAGYLVYQRLPEDQKARLQRQAKDLVQQRVNEIRQNFNI